MQKYILVEYIATMLFYLSTGPFLNTTSSISNKYNTEITPSGWTFSIWGVIYTWLSLMHAYILSTTCRRYELWARIKRYPKIKWYVIICWRSWDIYLYCHLRTVYGPMYCSPAVLPYGFFITWIANMLLNIGWLLLWDRE